VSFRAKRKILEPDPDASLASAACLERSKPPPGGRRHHLQWRIGAGPQVCELLVVSSGARLSFGSDWFVAPPTPIEGIYAAVTRRTLDDRNPGGWVPEQKISVDDALRAYTTGAAYASFDESRKGVLAAGRLADLVMLDRNLFDLPADQLRSARVAMTFVGGRKVFERPN
jgi:hypothetical protein